MQWLQDNLWSEKHEAIERLVVKNRNLGTKQSVSKFFVPIISQVCNGPGCETCPILAHCNEALIVNGQDLIFDQSLTCRSKSIFYVSKCRICSGIKIDQGKVLFEDTYFGQTVSNAHVRFNGHRKFSKCMIKRQLENQHCPSIFLISILNIFLCLISECE